MLLAVSLQATPLSEIEDGDTILLDHDDEPREVSHTRYDGDLLPEIVVTFVNGDIVALSASALVFVEVED